MSVSIEQPGNSRTNRQLVKPVNPKPFLKSLIDKEVNVRLKWNNTEYRGILLSVDNYMNLQLDEAVEFIDAEEKGKIGEIFIRCNNVLFVGKGKQGTEDAEMKEG